MSRRNILNAHYSISSGGVITFYVHLYVSHMRPNQPPLFDIIVDFICERGMTFRELIDSEYNKSLTMIQKGDATMDDGYLCFSTLIINNIEKITCESTNNLKLSDTLLVANLDDVIIENTTYETA